MPSVVTKADIESGLRGLGVCLGMALEVHSSLSIFGHVVGGAEMVIEALVQKVGCDGAVVMPAFQLSPPQPLDEADRALGITSKIKILNGDEPRSGMGLIADTFRRHPDVVTGEGMFRVCAWGKDARLHAHSGFGRIIDTDGWALLLGVDIYRLSAMHYVEGTLPQEISDIFKPSAEARSRYPEGEWLLECGTPPVRAWYTIQHRAYEKGLIKDCKIGDAHCMFFQVREVIGLYRDALQTDPLGLYGLKQPI